MSKLAFEHRTSPVRDVSPVSQTSSQTEPRVLVACPDSRPPAYQAAVALAGANGLDAFVTAFYYKGHGPVSELARKHFPERFARWRRFLKRRRDRKIPSDRVVAMPLFDAALQAEIRIPARLAWLRRALCRWRIRYFDRHLARIVERDRPEVVVVFSDGGSEFTLPPCRRLGIKTVVSMVTGDVREEREILDEQARSEPDFFPIYLGAGPIDRNEMDWIHERRLKDIALADLILVPSEHIASSLVRHGTPRERIRVVPYAADTNRFVPVSKRIDPSECTFLFAGGIAQRKGIKYLLDAWDQIKRPGWKLQLLGGLPLSPGPLLNRLPIVEQLGRVPHSDVPARMASADVFVFPSLFEGSAVVTYEALACGLPSVVTPNAGSVVRDGIEGFVVQAGNVAELADRMKRLGEDVLLRLRMSQAARERAIAFDWHRYHADVRAAVAELARA